MGPEEVENIPEAVADLSRRRWRVVRAPVRLRSIETDHDVFLPEHDIEIDGDDVLPVRFGGRLFAFTCKLPVGSYLHKEERDAYLFTDLGGDR